MEQKLVTIIYDYDVSEVKIKCNLEFQAKCKGALFPSHR